MALPGRILADMHHFGIGARTDEVRDPRRVAFDGDDQIGVGQIRRHVEAGVHRVVGRQADEARRRTDDGQRIAIGDRRQPLDVFGHAAHAGDDDQRCLGFGDPVREARDVGRRGVGRGWRITTHRERDAGLNLRRERLAGQSEVDGARR